MISVRLSVRAAASMPIPHKCFAGGVHPDRVGSDARCCGPKQWIGSTAAQRLVKIGESERGHFPAAEYESVESEVVGTWVNKSQLRELYELAVSAHPHGFLTIKLKAKNPLKMFAADFSRWLHPT